MKRFVISVIFVALLATRLFAATVYLRSTDGNDGDDGSTWALAKATLAASLTAAGAGGTVYVSQSHAEAPGTALTLTSSGTVSSPTNVICANDGAEPPTARATTGSCTGTTAVGFSGVAYCYGVTFVSAGTNSSALGVSGGEWVFDSSSLRLSANNTASRIYVGPSGAGTTAVAILRNSTVRFANASQGIQLCNGRIIWEGGSIAASGTAANNLIILLGSNRGGGCMAELTGLDLSGLATSASIFDVTSASPADAYISNSKLPTSCVYTVGAVAGQSLARARFVNCDTGDTNYKFYYQDYSGTVRDETTIVRSSGSSDGTTPISHKFVTTANSKYYSPLYGPWVTFWADSTGSKTVEAEVVTDNVTLTDAEAWIEVESLNDGSFPVSTLATDQISDPAFGTPANQTTSSVTWTTTGLTTPVKQTLSKTVTTAEKGPIRARVALSKASTTMYCDLLRLSGSARQWQSSGGSYFNEGASGGSNVVDPMSKSIPGL